MNQTITAKSPTRIDFSGGTLDCWPLYPLIGFCTTINLSIDIYTHASFTQTEDERIEIEIKNLNYRRSFSDLNKFLFSEDPDLDLLRPIISYFAPQIQEMKKGFVLSLDSESPIGAGLGASSSLCISLIKVFLEYLGIKKSTYELVTLAKNLETQVLKAPAGTQDYFPAIEYGLNFIQYDLSGVSSRLQSFDSSKFSDHLSLVFTQKPHHSGINNWRVIQSVINGDKKTLEILNKIAEISERTKSVLIKKEYDKLPALFLEETECRIQLSPQFSSAEIKKLQFLALKHGAEAVKICGSGGGGCVLLWSPKDKKSQVEEACQKEEFQVLKFLPVSL